MKQTLRQLQLQTPASKLLSDQQQQLLKGGDIVTDDLVDGI
ncbi:MAG: hypothetical protein AAF146_14845 [Bacteroidota bacterium]